VLRRVPTALLVVELLGDSASCLVGQDGARSGDAGEADAAGAGVEAEGSRALRQLEEGQLLGVMLGLGHGDSMKRGCDSVSVGPLTRSFE
jgi:hypothetical protein